MLNFKHEKLENHKCKVYQLGYPCKASRIFFQKQLIKLLFTAWKVSVFGFILVRIFPHSDWIRTRITSNMDTFYTVIYFYRVWDIAFWKYGGIVTHPAGQRKRRVKFSVKKLDFCWNYFKITLKLLLTTMLDLEWILFFLFCLKLESRWHLRYFIF